MIILKFKDSFRSIINFPEIELPDFTVITGVNGTGKTHLLRAISEGAIISDVAQIPEKEIKFFDWNSLIPNDTSECNVNTLYQEREQFISLANNAKQPYIEKLNLWGTSYKIHERNKLALLRKGKDYFSRLIDDTSKVDEAWSKLEAIANEIANKMQHDMGNNDPMRTFFQKIKLEIGLGVVSPDYQDFSDNIFGSSPSNFFQQSFAQIFLAYFELYKRNTIRVVQEQTGQTPDEPSLLPKDFVAKYNRPPWDFVNEILCEAGLDFDIDYPRNLSATKFTPQLRKITTGAEIRFKDLSSGEKVLMSFALCLYHSLDTRQEVIFPKLLLFDEIDAPLHPSMARQLVATIQEALVEKQRVKVILTTHSPSTVAVCPEDSLFVMRPNEVGLHKSGKRQAISVLTSEIPTLAISYSGQRQVFVESHLDAEYFGKVYQIISSRLNSERSLSFIGVGKHSPKGDLNGGCDQVKRIVSELAKHGNESVFGMVDWDTKNKSNGRLYVFAEGKRYSIENCLLDPLLIAAIAIRYDSNNMADFVGMPDGKGYMNLSDLNPQEYQTIVTTVEEHVLGNNEDNKVLVNYMGGSHVKISLRYLTMNGHYLEKQAKRIFPVLNQWQNQGDLIKKIIEQVLFDHPGLVPIEIMQVFQNILQHELRDG